MDMLLDIIESLGLNSSIYAQFIIFLVTYLFLYFLLFKPYFAAYTERKNRTEGSHELAERVIAETQDLEIEYQKKAREINSEFKTIYDQTRTKAIHEHDELVASARENAKNIVDSTRAQVEKEVKAVEDQLASEIPVVSEAIVSQLTSKGVTQ